MDGMNPPLYRGFHWDFLILKDFRWGYINKNHFSHWNFL